MSNHCNWNLRAQEAEVLNLTTPENNNSVFFR